MNDVAGHDPDGYLCDRRDELRGPGTKNPPLLGSRSPSQRSSRADLPTGELRRVCVSSALRVRCVLVVEFDYLMGWSVFVFGGLVRWLVLDWVVGLVGRCDWLLERMLGRFGLIG